MPTGPVLSDRILPPRYLTEFDSARMGHVMTDVLVIGGGVAGLTAAHEASLGADVILACKAEMALSSTAWAQGGVAAAVGAGDTVASHVADTLEVGASLNNPAAVEKVCREGAEKIRGLLATDMPFDRVGESLALGLEGGHSQPRVLHSGGDATGAALAAFLTARVDMSDRIRIFEQCFVIDLLTDAGQCVGAVTYHPRYGHQLIWARRTILATGGYGQAYRETTNPDVNTGDGVAAAFRAGAAITDLEFVQFHPTTLYIAGSTRALISEAVRGEGAYLLNAVGERFMTACHPDAELAPRDVVSRAIVDQIADTRAASVFLDVRHIDAEQFRKRFPNITARCAAFGIDVSHDLIPVRPAAHFCLGGVVTDLEARTGLPGLYACGEVACTGLHGANRLASNSLLEGLVMGSLAGRHAAEDVAGAAASQSMVRLTSQPSDVPAVPLDLGDLRQSLRSQLWRDLGVVRDGGRLERLARYVEHWCGFVLDKRMDEPAGWELQNMLTLAAPACAAAVVREESRGVHQRRDYPDVDARFAGHLAFRREATGAVVVSSLDLSLAP